MMKTEDALDLVTTMDQEGVARVARSLSGIEERDAQKEPQPEPEPAPMSFEQWRSLVIEIADLRVKHAKLVLEVARLEMRELEPMSSAVGIMVAMSDALSGESAQRARQLEAARIRRDAAWSSIQALTERLGTAELNIQ